MKKKYFKGLLHKNRSPSQLTCRCGVLRMTECVIGSSCRIVDNRCPIECEAGARVGRNCLLKIIKWYPKICSLTSINSKKSHHRKDSLQYNLQAAPASQGPAPASLKTNLFFWVRNSRWTARPISTPSPLQELVRDPFTAQKRAKNNNERGSAIELGHLDHFSTAIYTVFGWLRHALDTPVSPKTMDVLFFSRNVCFSEYLPLWETRHGDNARSISHASLSWSALNVLALGHFVCRNDACMQALTITYFYKLLVNWLCGNYNKNAMLKIGGFKSYTLYVAQWTFLNASR